MFWGECGCCAEGEMTMDTGTPEPQRKEQLTSPTIGPGPRDPGSSGVWGEEMGNAQVGAVPAGLGGSARHQHGGRG